MKDSCSTGMADNAAIDLTRLIGSDDKARSNGLFHWVRPSVRWHYRALSRALQRFRRFAESTLLFGE